MLLLPMQLLGRSDAAGPVELRDFDANRIALQHA